MKKIMILLLALSILLCTFVSCEQPDVPPTDSSDSDSGSEGEGKTDVLPDGSIVITPSEWDANLKKFWDSFVAGELGEAESITSGFYASYQAIVSPFLYKTDMDKTPINADVLIENAGIFSNPVKVETVINGNPTEAFISPLGIRCWQFDFAQYYGVHYGLDVVFLQAPALQTGDTDAYFITLTVTWYPSPFASIAQSISQYSTMFQVTEAQYNALLRGE
ncbi:MAG: hypothetical protein E7666_07120 [Ruminococcaceae bacterium]|nr:hypothetical protein [Oscillospiraceae bacterium]